MEYDKIEYKKLKRAYKLAVKANKVSFNFNGEVVLTTYAKYLLEYLSNKFE